MALNDLFGMGGGKPKLITAYTSGTDLYVPTVDMARCLVRIQAGGGGGGIVSFGPAGSINNTGAINYGGGGSTTGTAGVQTNYITTIPVYDGLQKEFVTSLDNAGNHFSQLNPLVQKIVFEYLSYNEFEDPIKTTVKDALINIDLDWLKQQSALNQMSFMNFFVKNNF